ncbi:MAG TPA: citramalate synthase [Anaerolineae bacterium]|jgi:2-isopropylmalate synthase|nr:citramalate synthase [Anaerolineae bacterium]
MNDNVLIYDTTLRDGTQREGISLSLNDKIRIAKRLDDFGVHYIEGGWPGSNPKDAEFFDAVRHMTFGSAKITAFGSTRRKNTRPEADPNLQALLDSNTPAVALVGKSWDLHVRDVLETDLEENLAMISESVGYLKSQGKEVIYDAEHFFDGYKANPEYALLTLKVAAEGGADVVVPCDTNGGALPWEISEILASVIDQIDTSVGIHTHDDSGCGVANTLAAVQVGAVHVQGTINGYGERVGNANLCTIIPDLQIKMGKRCVPPERLAQITELSRFVAEVANLALDDHEPFVGPSAFAHKGGIHVAAMRKNEASYQHIDPVLVGNRQRTVISELSGRGNVLDKAAEYGVDTSSSQAREVLRQIKDLEAQGFSFESAEASMSLMLHRLQPGYEPPFELLDFTVLVQHREERGLSADATIKVKVGDRLLHTAAEGNGPVNALDAALRKALLDVYPHLAEVNLSDYKVRILDSENGTGATVRVLIDTDNGSRRWSTVGASSNIIEASWQALYDSIEFALINGNAQPAA